MGELEIVLYTCWVLQQPEEVQLKEITETFRRFELLNCLADVGGGIRRQEMAANN